MEQMSFGCLGAEQIVLSTKSLKKEGSSDWGLGQQC